MEKETSEVFFFFFFFNGQKRDIRVEKQKNLTKETTLRQNPNHHPNSVKVEREAAESAGSIAGTGRRIR